jgi:hypothetical protein
MTLVNRRVFEELCLILTGLFAIFWAILRACVQAITLDEADTLGDSNNNMNNYSFAFGRMA